MLDGAIKFDKKLRKHNSFSDFRNMSKWKINESNIDSINLAIKKKQSTVKFLYHILLNENNDKDNNKKYNSSEEKKDLKKKQKVDEMSPLAQKFLKKANNKINEMNKSTLEIAQLNYLFYLNKPKVCDDYVKNRKMNKRTKSCVNIREKNLFDNLNSKSLIRNFVYINNNFHKQINDAFMKYNPIAHLNNMKLLLEAVPSFCDDISRVKEEVKNDIDFKTDKEKYKNKYENYLKKQSFLSINKSKQPVLKNSKSKSDINKSVSLPKLKLRMKEEHQKNMPLEFINKLRKNKGNDFKKMKKTKIEEMNKFIEVSDNINNLITKNVIEDKIEKCVDNYNSIKYDKDIGKDNSTLDLKKIDYFKKEKSIIEDNFKKIFLNKYFNVADEKEIRLLNKYQSEMRDFAIKNENNRNNNLNEFDNYLLKKNVSISDI